MLSYLRYLLVFLTIITVVGVTALFLREEPAEAVTAAPSATRSAESDQQMEMAPSRLVEATADTAAPEQLPTSLEGTRVPGGWRQLDADGHLLPTPALRGLFEYYLSALGEETLPELIARIRQALTELPEPARSEARQLLGDYLDYKLAVGELEADSSGADGLAAMERQLQTIRDLRREYLGQVAAEAFFAREEAIDRFQTRRREIMARDDLDDAQRKAELAAAEAELPEPLREARAESRKFMTYQARLDALENDPDATEADISRLRESTFGPEVAERLSQVEEAREDWKRRWGAYRDDLARLDTAGLAAPEYDSAVQRLRDQYFSDQEQVRVEALDSIE